MKISIFSLFLFQVVYERCYTLTLKIFNYLCHYYYLNTIWVFVQIIVDTPAPCISHTGILSYLQHLLLWYCNM